MKRRPARGKPGDLAALQKELWYALKKAGDLLDSENADVRLRAVHATSQASAAYLNVLREAVFNEELKTLQTRMDELEVDDRQDRILSDRLKGAA